MLLFNKASKLGNNLIKINLQLWNLLIIRLGKLREIKIIII